MEAHHHVVTMFSFSPYITYVQFSTQPLHRGINAFFFGYCHRGTKNNLENLKQQTGLVL